MNTRKHAPWATKYINIFGGLESLAERIPWSTGLSNMFEWITWNTGIVLGITKTQYANQIISWTDEEPVRGGTREQKLEYVRHKLEQELRRSEQSERYARPASSIASWREVLRRAKFFSEDYLNKEFDIFWTLVSDKYLDAFYGQFTRIKDGGRWSAHGNSGLFQANTGILEMQMDTLSYNETEALLIANELKLGGKKNPDQILKYALMFKLLRERKFIVPHARFVLLFIGGAKADPPWKALLEEEVSFCKNSPKETARAVCQPEVIEIAKSAEYASTSWSELITFNEAYRRKLDPKAQQVEDNLLWGFNESLKEKEFMQRNAGTTKVSVEHGHGAAKSKRRERLGGKLVRTQGDTAIGQSEGAREQKVRSSPGRSPVRLNRETFLNSCPPESREFFTNVLDEAEKRGLRVLWASESFLIHKKEQVLDFFRCKIAGYLELFIRDVPEKLHSQLLSLPAATKSSRFVIKIPVTSETLSDAEKAWNLALQTVFD